MMYENKYGVSNLFFYFKMYLSFFEVEINTVDCCYGIFGHGLRSCIEV